MLTCQGSIYFLIPHNHGVNLGKHKLKSFSSLLTCSPRNFVSQWGEQNMGLKQPWRQKLWEGMPVSHGLTQDMCGHNGRKTLTLSQKSKAGGTKPGAKKFWEIDAVSCIERRESLFQPMFVLLLDALLVLTTGASRPIYRSTWSSWRQVVLG